MARSINLSLTDELRAFLDQNSGDGTLFSTPSEFVRSLIREKKDRLDAAALRRFATGVCERGAPALAAVGPAKRLESRNSFATRFGKADLS